MTRCTHVLVFCAHDAEPLPQISRILQEVSEILKLLSCHQTPQAAQIAPLFHVEHQVGKGLQGREGDFSPRKKWQG